METTRDLWLGGRLVLEQPRRGYRAGMDAALLAAACHAAPGERVVELGCGAGAVLLAAAARRPDVAFLGVERDASVAALARRNIAANDLEDRVSVVELDVASPLAAAPFDHGLANPPFFDDPTRLRGPAPERRGAWIAEGGLTTWITALCAAVRDGGTLTIIHRADRLGDLLDGLSQRTGAIQIRPIQPFADGAAKRVVLRAITSARGPLRLLPPLVMHPRDSGKYTNEADAILRGETDLPWL